MDASTTTIPRFPTGAAVSQAPSTRSPRVEGSDEPQEFDLQISLRTGSAVLHVPGHPPIHLTSDQREQLAEWLAPTEKAE